eukprot:gene2152-5182_t
MIEDDCYEEAVIQSASEEIKTSFPRDELKKQFQFFHGAMHQHVAESLLHHGSSGMYLLRELPCDDGSPSGNLCFSVRNIDAIHHFLVAWDGEHFQLGDKTFSSVQELGKCFEQIGFFEKNGNRILLSSPYPRSVDEKNLYQEVSLHTDWGTAIGASKKKEKRKVALPMQRTCSMEGYLVKLGKVCKDKLPIRTMDVTNCQYVGRMDLPDKQHTFCLRMPDRTFIMCASSEQEADRWVSVLQQAKSTS